MTTGVDPQEVDNAINQAQKELAQRYDFKGSKATLEFKRAEAMLVLVGIGKNKRASGRKKDKDDLRRLDSMR